MAAPGARVLTLWVRGPPRVSLHTGV